MREFCEKQSERFKALNGKIKRGELPPLPKPSLLPIEKYEEEIIKCLRDAKNTPG